MQNSVKWRGERRVASMPCSRMVKSRSDLEQKYSCEGEYVKEPSTVMYREGVLGKVTGLLKGNGGSQLKPY